MRTDGVFTTKVFRINWQVGKTLSLIPFGDVHFDSPEHSESEWQRFTDFASKKKDALFLGMGDYTDSYSTSERVIMYDRNLHESSKKRHEQEAIGRLARFAKTIEFMRGRLIGLLGGNHYCELSNGTTGDHKLAEMLGCRYLGSCCAIRIVFVMPGKDRNRSIDVFAHHGRGGGTTAGGRFNSVEKMASVCEADIYLMGDNHARGCFTAGERMHLMPSNNGVILKSKARWIGRTGSFLRGYVDGHSSYIVDALLPPANLGWIEFTLTPRRIRNNNEDTMHIEIGAIQ